MTFLIILGVLLFRWVLLERLFGTKRMLLFDAILFTVFAASEFANPGVTPWIGYALGFFCTFVAISSGQDYLTFIDEKTEDDAKV